MDARVERGQFDHELQHTSPVGNDSSENIDIFANSPGFQHGHEYLYHAMQEENTRQVPGVPGHPTHTVSQSENTYLHNFNNDERLHALFQASSAPSSAAETNHGQRRLSEIEDNLHGVQRKLGEIGEHFSAFSNTLERLLLGRETAPMGSSHLLPSEAAPHGLDMRHNAASGNLFCAEASGAAPGILPPDPLRVEKPEYEILSFREEILQGQRWPLRITSKTSTDRGTHYNMSKGGDLAFTFSLQELEAETVESTSVYYATTEKNETARSVRKRNFLTLAELRRRNSRLDKIEKLGERSKFKKNTFLNVGDATTKKPRTRSQSQDDKL